MQNIPEASTFKLTVAATDEQTTYPAVFFKQAVRLIINKPYEIESELAKLQDTQHLAYCLEQTTLSEAQKKPLTDLATKIVDLFASRATKTLPIVQEVAPLAAIPHPDIYQSLLNQALKTLQEPLLNAHVVQGLAVMIRKYPSTLIEESQLSSSDLMDGLKVLLGRLQNAYQHDKDTTRLQTLLLTLTHLLEAMALIGATGISRVHVQDPLKKILSELSKHQALTIQFQVRYARQALAHIPNDESTSKAVLRRTSSVAKGVLQFAHAIKTLDPIKLFETFKHFSEALSGAEEIAKELISLAKGTHDASATLKKGRAEIREGLDFNWQSRWYAALQATDIMLAQGELSQFEIFIRNSPYRQHPDFLQGLCQRLEQIARSYQDEPIQCAAVEFLADLTQNPAQWKPHSALKQGASNTLGRLATALTGTAQTRVQEILKRLHPHWIPNEQTSPNYVRPVWDSIWHKVPSSQLLSEARGDLARFKQQQEIELRTPKEPLAILGQNIEEEYFTAWEEPGEIQEGLAMYVAPQATIVTDRNTVFDLDEAVTAFLKQEDQASQKIQVLLLRGEAGSGKSTFNRHLARRLWREYSAAPASDEAAIPLYISLPAIENPNKNLIGQYLSDQCSFSPEQIESLRQSQRFTLILDGYDEIPAEQRNLYADEKLDKWQAKIILSSRPEYLIEGYQNLLQPRGYSRFLLEYQLAPFSEQAIETYINQYVRHTHAQWSVQHYQYALECIPHIKELIGIPFLLKMTLSVLPTLEKAQPGPVGLTRIKLYKQFAQTWFERSLARLDAIQSKLTEAQKSALYCLKDEGFIKHSQAFNADFALALAKAQTTVAEYSPIARQGIVQDKRYEPFLSNKDEKNNLLRFSALLIRQHQQYRFIHKSVQDYWVARAIWEELESSIGLDSSKDFEPLNGIKNVQPLWEELGPVIQVEPATLLNCFNLVEDLAVQHFLIERVEQNKELVKPLLAWTKASATQNTVKQGAANAITLLVRVGVQFNGMDLKGIQIPGADLSYGVFDSVQLQEADLTGVNLRASWLSEASLNNTQMAEVQFGERPYLQEESEVNFCAYSPDGKTCAVGLSDGAISVYKTSNWEKSSALIGHTNPVNSVVYSPQGDQLASSDDNWTVRLWDVKTGMCLHILIGHTDKINSLVYSPQGDQLASGSVDTTVRLWNVKTGDCLHTFISRTDLVNNLTYSPEVDQLASISKSSLPPRKAITDKQLHTLMGHTPWINSVVYSPQGDQLASSGGFDTTVRLWDVKTGAGLLILSGHTSRINSVAYSPQGDQLASGSSDGTVRLWDVKTGACLLILSGHTSRVNSVAYSPQGDQLASSGDNWTIRLWDVKTGICLHTLSNHLGSVNSMVYSPQGDQLASSDEYGTVRVWDTKMGVCLYTFIGHTSWVNSLAYSPQGNQLASGSNDKTVRLWDVKTDTLRPALSNHASWVSSIVYPPQRDQFGSGSDNETMIRRDTQTIICFTLLSKYAFQLSSVAYSPQGDQLASSDSDGRTVRLWDAKTGACLIILSGHTLWISNVVYSPQGDQLASGSGDETVRLWDVKTGACLHTLIGHSGWVNSLAYSPQGDQLASAGSVDRTVRLWDVKTGACLHIFIGHTDSVNNVVYSPQGDQLASGSSDETVRLWDVKTGACLHTFIGHTASVNNVMYSPEGNQLASGSTDGTVRLWDVKTGVCLHILNGHTPWVSSVAYSLQGDQLASGDADGTVRLWDVKTGTCLHICIGHTNSVNSVVYSLQGDQLASGSQDKTMRLWDIKTGRCLRIIQDFTRPIGNIAWRKAPNGNYLVTNEGKSVRQWEVRKENGEYKVVLCWSSMQDRLTARGVSIEEIEGLSEINRRLLKQHGAVSECIYIENNE